MAGDMTRMLIVAVAVVAIVAIVAAYGVIQLTGYAPFKNVGPCEVYEQRCMTTDGKCQQCSSLVYPHVP